MKRPAFLLALTAVAGCGSDFDPSSRVTGLRLLATRADQPFARPGERVRLEALAVDGRGEPFHVAWASCARPASTSALGCLEAIDAGAPVVQGPEMVQHTVTVPADILDGVPPAGAPLITFGAVQVVCPGPVTVAPSPGELPLRCADDDGEIGVKRLFVRNRDRNANPEIAEVQFDGAPWPPDELRRVSACADADENRFDRCDGPSHRISLALADGAAEQGTDELGVAFAEALIVQYYATEGLFESEVKDARSSETRFKARAAAAGTPITMWFVVRDDRGGVTWTSRRAEVAP